MEPREVKKLLRGYTLVAEVSGELGIPYELRHATREEIIGYWNEHKQRELQKAMESFTLDQLIRKTERAKKVLRSMDED